MQSDDDSRDAVLWRTTLHPSRADSCRYIIYPLVFKFYTPRKKINLVSSTCFNSVCTRIVSFALLSAGANSTWMALWYISWLALNVFSSVLFFPQPICIFLLTLWFVRLRRTEQHIWCCQSLQNKAEGDSKQSALSLLISVPQHWTVEGTDPPALFVILALCNYPDLFWVMFLCRVLWGATIWPKQNVYLLFSAVYDLKCLVSINYCLLATCKLNTFYFRTLLAAMSLT